MLFEINSIEYAIGLRNLIIFIMGFKSKFDSPLKEIYDNYLEIKEKGREGVRRINPALKNGLVISVQISYQGDISVLVDKGFQLQWETGGTLAHGYVHVKDLEILASSDQILRMEYGMDDTINLDTSVKEILARGMPPMPPPFIWSVNQSNGNFTGSTGEGVIIGVIDSGIDFTHPVFLKSTGPDTSRILRIWDPGLIAVAGENPPNVSRLLSTDTYGVEYTNAQINDVLRNVSGATPIRHRDCNTHGTHVAATAAGDGRAIPFLSSTAYDYVGVAPKADIIAVKIFSLEHDPTTPPPANAVINFQQRFKDAVTYIKKVVELDYGNRPLVINYSGGNSLGPHDGLTIDELWLSGQFGTEAGKICVVAAGNSAGASKMQHSVITMPVGSIEIPFELYDTRVKKTDYNKCTNTDNTSTLYLDLWYKDINPDTLTVELKLPGGTFSAALALSGADQSGTFDGGKSYRLSHSPVSTTPVPLPTITRNNIKLKIGPDGNMHKTGTYTLKLTTTRATVVHAWCSRASYHGFKPITPLPAGVAVTDLNTVGSPGSASNVITVAAYNDISGDIASFSSNGPLVDYSGAGPISAKPDIAAPGVAIKAAESQFGSVNGPWLKNIFGSSYKEMQGTSMAAPHVAGLVALLLEKNGTLDTPAVLALLQNNKRPVVPANPNGFGAGKLNAEASFNHVPPVI